MIFALLLLKANEPKKGLSQEEIVDCLIGNEIVSQISRSTVSRTLKSLNKGYFCDFEGDNVREKRKYFTKRRIKDLSVGRLKHNIQDGELIIQKLSNLIMEIPEIDKKIGKNSNLIGLVEEIILIFEIVNELYEEMLIKTQERIKDV
jgi:hypothetical protein